MKAKRGSAGVVKYLFGIALVYTLFGFVLALIFLSVRGFQARKIRVRLEQRERENAETKAFDAVLREEKKIVDRPGSKWNDSNYLNERWIPNYFNYETGKWTRNV